MVALRTQSSTLWQLQCKDEAPAQTTDKLRNFRLSITCEEGIKRTETLL